MLFPHLHKALPVSSNPKATLQTLTDIQKRQRLAIKIVSIIGLLSLFSMTMTVYAWGTGDATIYYLLLYPALIITTILLIANVRFAFFLIIIFCFIYVTILNSEIGKLFVFDRHNNILYLVLALPYFTLLTLIPLTTSFLTGTSKHKKILVSIAIIIAIGFPTFAIAERYNMNYSDNIFIDAEISSQGQVTLNCKPGFGDTRTFIVKSNSSKIADQIKRYGEYYQGSYFLQNTAVKKNFNFSTLKSVTLLQIDNNKIDPELTWTTKEIKGDISFLKP
jgi:hypothetical protein